ncbi:hypothetical protein PIB30_075134 [Stylosanthes scabra]|uniref:Uncharacterized protein n=1 Tax=Stylosanthes scabra TaxID=79078 RepID=A0ABU6TPH1_9FABA|nr:hypothetical protein [Stylosanthes scabra]
MAGVGESEDGYEWVNEAVLGIASMFVDTESVRQLGSPLLWVRNGQNIKFEFLPCSYVERVCHEGKDADWFFIYTCVFAEIETKVPDCSTAGLKSFFKQRAEREVSTSHVVKVEHGSEVNKPFERKKQVTMKRMRSEEASEKKVTDLTERKCCGKKVSLEDTVKFTRSQKDLHGFEGTEDLSSVWCEHFPFTVVADEHFQSKGDLDLLERAGPSCSIHVHHLRVGGAGFGGRGLPKKKVELEKRLKMAAEQVDLKEKEIRLLKDESEDLKNKVARLSKDKQDLEGRIVDLCEEKKEAEESKKQHGFQMFAVAWDRAKAQAKMFAPEIKFDKMDPVKVVCKGELIDDDQVLMEDNDDHNPAE